MALGKWGEWSVRSILHDGYTSVGILYKVWKYGGFTDFPSGHVVLCLDYPRDVWEINKKIIQLPEHYRKALFIKFAWFRDHEHKLITDKDRAKYLHMSKGAFKSKVRRAVYALKSI